MTKVSIPHFNIEFHAGDLVQIWSQSTDPNARPVLFVEDVTYPEAIYKIISKTTNVENGTIAFLLEDYESEFDGVIEVLVRETVYLTLTSQLKKIYLPI